MIGFLCSLVYLFDCGVYLLNAVDHMATNYMLMLMATLKAFIIGWVWAWQELQGRLGALCAPFTSGPGALEQACSRAHFCVSHRPQSDAVPNV